MQCALAWDTCLLTGLYRSAYHQRRECHVQNPMLSHGMSKTHMMSNNTRMTGPLVVLGSLDLGVFLPVAVSCLLPGTNASIVSSSDKKIAYDSC
jgi:hypothetical protein